ncbi:MAG: efflux RND transporter periplasmic adaptor subunit [Candidatus Eisenbacteria bacterium]|nr:efflux RND transporter periplasmic adaptor subunit [Candidatus Eisenbacteria bacterium]
METPNASGRRRAAARTGHPRRALALATALALVAGCGNGRDAVTASGTVELDEVDVASLIGGRVVTLRVDEGDTVRAGDTLAVLDQGEVLAGLDARRAEAQRALAQWRDLEAGPRAPEVQTGEAELRATTAQWTLAQAELERIQALYDHHVVAASDLDRARTARDTAAARREAAAKQVQLLRAGSRAQQVTAARSAALAAEAQVAAARSRAHELVLTAPAPGVVLLREFEPGEIVPAGVPVVTLGDPERLWMRVYVPAPQLARVRLGAAVEVRAQGYGGRAFAGRVVAIATHAEFTPRAALTEEERANLVFGVKVALEPSGGALKAGLPADARILAPPAPPRR